MFLFALDIPQGAPTVPTLESVAPWVREFGVTISVLFLLLLFGMTMISIFVIRFGKQLDDIGKTQEMHVAKSNQAIQDLDIRKDVAAFRDSERDCINNLSNALALHAKACEQGCSEQKSIATDVAQISASVDILVSILTLKRRKPDNGAD